MAGVRNEVSKTTKKSTKEGEKERETHTKKTVELSTKN